MSSWLAVDDVLAELGLDVADSRVQLATDAAETQVAGWRPDIGDWNTVDEVAPNVYLGAVQYAALLVQSRNTPDGFAGFDMAGGIVASSADQSKLAMIRRLVRAGKPGVG